jgi:hypothetical protein
MEAWYVEYTGQLDLFTGLVGECHDPAPLNWDNGIVAKSHSTMYCTIELGEGCCSLGHVARRTSVEVLALNLVGVAICTQEDMCGWLM